MKRILVFSKTDWLQPAAPPPAVYVHEVFSRIASEGHYVALVSHRPLPFRAAARRSRLETSDSIQIARLGMPFFFSRMVKLFLARLAKTDHSRKPSFDVIIDCVTGAPLPIEDHAPDLDVVPLVFSLKGALRANEEMPGPVIAASEAACTAMEAAGVPEKFIVRALPGEDEDAWKTTAGIVLGVLENMRPCAAADVLQSADGG
jgi:hypothetical protein